MHRSNTTFDVYLGGRLPPAVPDVAGAAGFLRDEWVQGNQVNKGDRTFFFTATLEAVLGLGVNLPDAYPGTVSDTTLWVPDQGGAAYTVVFVERERAFRGDDFQRVYLIKGFVVAITVRDVNLLNVYPNTSLLEFHDADGFVVSQPAANQVRIRQTPADATHVGYISLANQTMGAGDKTFQGNVIVDLSLTVEQNIFLTTEVYNGSFTTAFPPAGYINWPAAGGIEGYLFVGIDNDWSGGAMVLFTGSTVLEVRGDAGATGPGHVLLYAPAGSPYFAIKVGSSAIARGLTGISAAGDTVTGGLITTAGSLSGQLDGLGGLTGTYGG
jgi:hypothetical protein